MIFWSTPARAMRQYQQPRLQGSKGHRAPSRACVIYSKTVLILMRPEVRRSLYIDCVMICTGTDTSYWLTKRELILMPVEWVISYAYEIIFFLIGSLHTV